MKLLEELPGGPGQPPLLSYPTCLSTAKRGAPARPTSIFLFPNWLRVRAMESGCLDENSLSITYMLWDHVLQLCHL